MHHLKNKRVSRRDLLKGGGGMIAMSVMPGGLILGANNAWAASPKAISADTFACLVQACRDIYPHDDLADSYYAKVVEGFDDAAADSDEEKKVLEDGAAMLDAKAESAHGSPYMHVGWEADRTAILREIEEDSFFQKLRGALVTGIYNNPDVWAMLGYEGESASKGGYINRGFDDIDWLDQV